LPGSGPGTAGTLPPRGVPASADPRPGGGVRAGSRYSRRDWTRRDRLACCPPAPEAGQNEVIRAVGCSVALVSRRDPLAQQQQRPDAGDNCDDRFRLVQRCDPPSHTSRQKQGERRQLSPHSALRRELASQTAGRIPLGHAGHPSSAHVPTRLPGSPWQTLHRASTVRRSTLEACS
jgi:hypothetical protein